MKHLIKLFLLVCLGVSTSAQAVDTYDHVKNELTIPAVVLGDTVYRNVVVTVGPVLTVGGSNLDAKYVPKSTDSFDSYDPYKNQLSIPSVNAYGAVYYDVVVNVSTVLSVGSGNRIASYALTSNSYYNLKNNLKSQIVYPRSALGTYDDAMAFAIGNFTKDKLSDDLFVARQTYFHHLVSKASDATASVFEFYSKDINGEYKKRTDLLDSEVGCIHPRKSAVADLNKDGQADIVVFCHGVDIVPYPGEQTKVLLSQPDGKYKISNIGPEVEFFHTGSVEDLNNDGWPDVITIGKDNFIIYLNNKDGTFKRGSLPGLENLVTRNGGLAGQFNMQVLDLNNDGKYDIVIGGGECSPENNFRLICTRIIFNSADGLMQNPSQVVLPGVTDWHTINDFVYVKTATKDFLYISRNHTQPNFSGFLVQEIDLSNLQSRIIYEENNVRWWPWIITCKNNNTTYICRDDSRYPGKVAISN